MKIGDNYSGVPQTFQESIKRFRLSRSNQPLRGSANFAQPVERRHVEASEQRPLSSRPENFNKFVLDRYTLQKYEKVQQ
jgi:hypothetical protein